MSEKQSVSQREFARMIGRSDAMIRKYITKGQITQRAIDLSDPKKPKIFVAQAKLDLSQNLGSSHNSKDEKRVKTRHNRDTRDLPLPGGIFSDSVIDDDFDNDAQVEAAQLAFLNGTATTAQLMSLTSSDLDKLKKIREIQNMEQKFMKEARLLVPIAEVDEALFKAGQIIRQSAENWTNRVVDQILGMTDRDEVSAILEKEVDVTLNLIADAGNELPR